MYKINTDCLIKALQDQQQYYIIIPVKGKYLRINTKDHDCIAIGEGLSKHLLKQNCISTYNRYLTPGKDNESQN